MGEALNHSHHAMSDEMVGAALAELTGTASLWTSLALLTELQQQDAILHDVRMIEG
jgi:hypothetical protein